MEWNMIEEFLPKVLSGGMSIIWSLACLFVGIKVISILRKLLRGALERSSVDTGVVQFLDELVKWGAYAVLILSILARFGIQTTSFITLLGSAGVAIGLSLQGSLANFAGGILILVLKPFVVGDYISACGCEGTVTEISIFLLRCIRQTTGISLFPMVRCPTAILLIFLRMRRAAWI